MSAEGMKAMCWIAMYALAFTLAPLNAAAGVDPQAGAGSSSLAQSNAQAEA